MMKSLVTNNRELHNRAGKMAESNMDKVSGII